MTVKFIGAAGMLITTLIAATLLTAKPTAALASTDPEPGQLTIVNKNGKVGALCPLEGTKVVADISGFGARVDVVQTFKNPSNEAIEAIYTFPLPNDAAVDRMTMSIGDRVIEGVIKRREEARMIYDAARNAGQSAALLDQERPNIFTQSVANIMPGAKVQIRISYVQILKYEEGQFEFKYPMVVGPRYTANAPDPNKIAPPIVQQGTRTGSNIDLTVNLDAGAPIQGFESVLHKVQVDRRGDARAVVRLAKANEIPNRDFILRYRMATDSVQSAFLTHMGEKGGFFSLILMPPKAPKPTQIAPREVIFVMDQSGSQSGFPIEKSKELTLKLIKTLRPGDTFNVLGFNTQVRSLWPYAKPNTPANLREAEGFVHAMQANGGTHIREGVIASLQGQSDPDRLRLVIFNTDGYVGDEALILDTIQKNRNHARMFTFGIGNSVNRFLIDEMAVEGKGDAEYVTLAEAADGAVERFVRRTQTPILTDISAKFEGIEIQDALPDAIPDVFSEKPVIITGRYPAAGHGTLTLTGNLGGQPWTKTLELDFPAQAHAPALESIWARQKVDQLTRRNYLAEAYPAEARVQSSEIVDVALEFSIMSQFTSFVAVEQRVVNIGGKQRRVAVPVEMADGVSYEGIFGREQLEKSRMVLSAPTTSAQLKSTNGVASTGFGGGGFSRGKSRDDELNVDMSTLKPEERRKRQYELKVGKKLRSATGKVEVEIWLAKCDAATLAKLEKIGFKPDFKDEKVKLVMGVCDQKILVELAQVEEVQRINPL